MPTVSQSQPFGPTIATLGGGLNPICDDLEGKEIERNIEIRMFVSRQIPSMDP